MMALGSEDSLVVVHNAGPLEVGDRIAKVANCWHESAKAFLAVSKI